MPAPSLRYQTQARLGVQTDDPANASAPRIRDQAMKLKTIQVSVVIGTYNRAHLLKGTLEALASQAVPDSLKWEIVVVDNNSHDTTAQVVTAFSKTTATSVRYVFESEPGVS